MSTAICMKKTESTLFEEILRRIAKGGVADTDNIFIKICDVKAVLRLNSNEEETLMKRMKGILNIKS